MARNNRVRAMKPIGRRMKKQAAVRQQARCSGRHKMQSCKGEEKTTGKMIAHVEEIWFSEVTCGGANETFSCVLLEMCNCSAAIAGSADRRPGGPGPPARGKPC